MSPKEQKKESKGLLKTLILYLNKLRGEMKEDTQKVHAQINEEKPEYEAFQTSLNKITSNMEETIGQEEAFVEKVRKEEGLDKHIKHLKDNNHAEANIARVIIFKLN